MRFEAEQIGEEHLIRRLVSRTRVLVSMKGLAIAVAISGISLSGTDFIIACKNTNCGLYMKLPPYRSGGDLLVVESPELFITGLTSGEPILGDMVIDEGGDTTLL